MAIVLIHADGSNCGERVRWALEYKRIAYDFVDGDRIAPEDLRAVVPFGTVPGMIIDGTPLGESMAMVEYLEERFPDPPLLPREPILRAKVREVCEVVNATIHPAQNANVPLFYLPGQTRDAVKPLRLAWIRRTLPLLLPLVQKTSGFAVGDALSLADFFVVPMWARAVRLGMPEDEIPELAAHAKFVLGDPRVRAACPVRLPDGFA